MLSSEIFFGSTGNVYAIGKSKNSTYGISEAGTGVGDKSLINSKRVSSSIETSRFLFSMISLTAPDVLLIFDCEERRVVVEGPVDCGFSISAKESMSKLRSVNDSTVLFRTGMENALLEVCCMPKEQYLSFKRCFIIVEESFDEKYTTRQIVVLFISSLQYK